VTAPALFGTGSRPNHREQVGNGESLSPHFQIVPEVGGPDCCGNLCDLEFRGESCNGSGVCGI
jgi:hypothetical protein